MSGRDANRSLKRVGLMGALALAGFAAGGLLAGQASLFTPALAQSQGNGQGQGQGQGGSGSGSGSGKGGAGGQYGSGSGHSKAVQELEDLLRGSGRGGMGAEADEDSDRPNWAQGNRDLNPHAQGGGQPGNAGSKKGDLYGDLYVILRDANGVPILKTLPSGEQVVQPIDADGNLIPLNDEGDPVDAAAEALLQPVEFSRLSVGRSPTKVLTQSLDEALSALASIYTLDADHNIVIADGASVSYDSAGRLVVTVDGVSKTIDSPLENLALYTDLMVNGSLSTVVTLSYKDATNQTVYVTKEVTFVPDQDLKVAASLLAAAADKTGTINIDLVAYENSILGINQTTDGQTVSYFDYSTFTYDRLATYGTSTIKYLEPTTNDQGQTVYVVVEKTILDAVFGGSDGVFDSATENVTASNIAGFADATDDALQVIEFVHDHQIPES